MAMEHRGLEKIGGYILIEFKLTLVELFHKTFSTDITLQPKSAPSSFCVDDAIG